MNAETLNTVLMGVAALGGLAGIGALLKTLATLKTAREAGEIANSASAVDALQKTIDGFEDVIADLKAERNEAKQEARTERDRAEAYRQGCLTAEGGFCTNYGCPLREPARGLGAAWIRDNAGKPNIGGNYKNLPTLMADKGISCIENVAEREEA